MGKIFVIDSMGLKLVETKCTELSIAGNCKVSANSLKQSDLCNSDMINCS